MARRTQSKAPAAKPAGDKGPSVVADQHAAANTDPAAGALPPAAPISGDGAETTISGQGQAEASVDTARPADEGSDSVSTSAAGEAAFDIQSGAASVHSPDGPAGEDLAGAAGADVIARGALTAAEFEAARTLLQDQGEALAGAVTDVEIWTTAQDVVDPIGGAFGFDRGDAEILLGSSILPAHIDIGLGAPLTLGEVVCAAYTLSGLSEEAWNGLPESVRDQVLAVTIEGAKEGVRYRNLIRGIAEAAVSSGDLVEIRAKSTDGQPMRRGGHVWGASFKSELVTRDAAEVIKADPNLIVKAAD